MFQHYARQMNNEIAFGPGHDADNPVTELPELVQGDQIRLKQIMINLIKNVLKFTVNGKVLLQTKYNRMVRQLWVTLSMRGSAISQSQHAEIHRIFQKVGFVAEDEI